MIRTTILLASIAFAAAPSFAEGDAAAGAASYATCVACHGDNGQGNKAMSAPRINHLEQVYVAAQLNKFRSGVRGGQGATPTAMTMAPMAAVLADDAAVANVAAYIAGLESPASAASVEGDATMGADYYNQFCGACHGAGAVGNPALNSPRLAGGDDWYLEAQLLAFRSGARGAHPDDKTGKQMRAMAMILPDEQAVRDVVAYLHGLGE
ncbi:c-type cytochrome [Halioglobus maricola]|uniref:C-type cytochrome n=1 Tax=Halioglobus maricola TaxID=2601894 RepID=A0A5P9NP48_9GAMM|nr:c-type cytochrome [Halioglobus maricola]QFU77439.1 c-type cytochrome [Halioglobus maricola]